MAIERTGERVAFSRTGAPCPTLLYAGQRYGKESRGTVNRVPPHFLIHYITAGSGTVRHDGGPKTPLSAGDLFVCFPDQRAAYREHRDDPWTYLWLGFQGDGAWAILRRAGLLPEAPVRHGKLKHRDIRLLEGIVDALTGQGRTRDIRGNILLLQFLERLVDSAPAGPRPRRTSATALQERVDQACVFMVNHYVEGIQAEDVSRYIGLERSYFSKVFSELAQTTIREYLSNLRRQRAEELLRESRLSVAAIADAVGFSESRTFSRFFKQQTGLSPQHWRERD